jgi:hypothetical protein
MILQDDAYLREYMDNAAAEVFGKNSKVNHTIDLNKKARRLWSLTEYQPGDLSTQNFEKVRR